MKKLFIVLPLAFLLCFTFGCQQGEEMAEETAVDVDADKEAIKVLLNNNASVISAEDLDGWLAQFTDDAIFMNPNAEILKGVEASRVYAIPVFEQFDHEIAITIDEVEVEGDFAFARTIGEETYTPKTGEGDPIKANSKGIFLLQRMTDGTWLCTRCIWNSNDPLS